MDRDKKDPLQKMPVLQPFLFYTNRHKVPPPPHSDKDSGASEERDSGLTCARAVQSEQCVVCTFSRGPPCEILTWAAKSTQKRELCLLM